MKTAIKICGITSVADAELAIAAGATHIGLIFVAGSPRCLGPERARAIADNVRGRVAVVGVFKDSPAERVVDVASAVGLDLVQYHGAESPAYIEKVDLPAIKTFELRPGFDWAEFYGTHRRVVHVLFDRPKGERSPGWLDWAVDFLLAADRRMPPLFFAGGLAPDNVARVVSRLRPFGVDVASGVEREPGAKDPDKVRAFCNTVVEASGEVSGR